jgi:hypothetical protein
VGDLNEYRLSIAIALIIVIATSATVPIVYAVRNGVRYTRQYYRPIIGGIQIQLVNPIFRSNCSIGYIVRDPNGNLGFITAGHCSLFETGWRVYQPDVTRDTYYVGTVTWVAPQYFDWQRPAYDWEFIAYSNVDVKVLYALNYTYFMIDIGGYSRYADIRRAINAGNVIPVNKTGRTTGTTGGVIRDTWDSCAYSCWVYGPRICWIRYCLITSLYAEPGDSGAPAFVPIFLYYYFIPYVTLVGHVVASNRDPQNPITIVQATDAITDFGYRIVTYYGG